LLSAAFVVAAPIIIEEIEFLIHYLDFQHEILSSLS
jgi:hypothetical protein